MRLFIWELKRLESGSEKSTARAGEEGQTQQKEQPGHSHEGVEARGVLRK